MKVVIVGAGAVGFNLASTLSAEGHEISVIERRDEQLQRVRDRLDVDVVEGNGTSAEVLQGAGITEADLFIAVTDNDEVNMVACSLAHVLMTRGRRIARVRNQDFTGRDPIVPKRTFGISRLIDPDEATVSVLLESIMHPGVTDVAEYAGGEILLRGTVLREGSPFVGQALAELRERYHEVPFLIAAIDRGDELLIPSGDTQLQEGDHLFLILRRDGLHRFRELVVQETEGVQKVVVFGASRIGVRLCEQMEKLISELILIEPDQRLAEEAARVLEKSLVLHGAVTDPAILAEAGVNGADYFVATSVQDEMNLVAAALANRMEDGPRVAVLTANPDFVPALSTLDIDLVINERLITVENILRFVRPGRYLSVKRLNEQGAEILELSVQKGAKADGRTLKKLKLPSGALVVAIHRDGQAILPTGESEVHSGDTVVLVAQPSVREKAALLFFDKKWVSLQEHHRR